jgi:hypothetical protein
MTSFSARQLSLSLSLSLSPPPGSVCSGLLTSSSERTRFPPGKYTNFPWLGFVRDLTICLRLSFLSWRKPLLKDIGATHDV